MKYVLALMVFVLGLEGVDRALLERGMASLKPPHAPNALRALINPSLLPPPPAPPPPPPAPLDGGGAFP